MVDFTYGTMTGTGACGMAAIAAHSGRMPKLDEENKIVSGEWSDKVPFVTPIPTTLQNSSKICGTDKKKRKRALRG